MGFTDFPHGITSFGIPIYGSGVGPPGAGTGNIYYMVTSKSSSSKYWTILSNNGVSDNDMFTTLATAYAAVTTGQNDTILVTPGLYTETASVTWDKDNVHFIGVGGHTYNHSDWTLTQGCPVFYTATIDQAQIINLTGERNTFHNTVFENYGNNAACLQAIKVDGYGNSFYNCGFHGIMTTNQVATAACCSLNIAGGGHYLHLSNCEIGTREWGTRTDTTSGHLRFTATSGSGPSFGWFDRCTFLSHAETAAVPMVYFAAQMGASSLWRYTNCLFYNFWTNNAGSCSVIFKFAGGGLVTQAHVLENCTAVGYTEWQSQDSPLFVYSAMPVVSTGGGGLATTMDEPTGS